MGRLERPEISYNNGEIMSRLHQCQPGEGKRKFRIDLVGKRYGRLVVIKRGEYYEKGTSYYWICQCDCGNTTSVGTSQLRFGNTNSCGCFLKENRGWRKKDLTGQRFGKLVAIKTIGKRKGSGSYIWECLCDCGNKTYRTLLELRRSKIVSCGCYHSSFNPNLTEEDRNRKRFLYEDKKWTRNILERDDFTCQSCFLRGGRLIAHHLDGFCWCKEKRRDLKNGITLCDNCHKKFHKEYGNRKNTFAQFELFRKLKVA